MLLLPWVSADLRKTDFTFCAPHTWNKLEPDAVRAAGHSPLINSEYKGCNLFVWINPRILFLHFRTHTCVCVFFLVCAKIHVLGMLAKVKHSRPHLAALISQIGRAVSWWDQASLEAWTEAASSAREREFLPGAVLPGSAQTVWQTNRRLWQTTVDPSNRWARPNRKGGSVRLKLMYVCGHACVCMCAGAHICI